ncbi:hypothetical protein HDU86_007193 [Geranomyces michiganensis]|nr:hypothetical protein HDU86_007193 [Geranomyces michiganensis]
MLFSSLLTSSVALLLGTAVAAQQHIAPQQSVQDHADVAIPDQDICEGRLKGTPELLADHQLSKYPFAANFDPETFDWTEAQFQDFSTHGVVPAGHQSLWTATEPWTFPQFPTPGSQNPLSGQIEVDPEATARCSEGGSGPDYASYTLLHGGNQTLGTAQFQLSQDIDVKAYRKDIDSGKMRALGVVSPTNNFEYTIFFRFANAKNEILQPSISMSDDDVEARQIPVGTTTVRFGIIVNMADIDPDLIEEVCFDSFSVNIARFDGSADFVNNGDKQAATITGVAVILCFVNILVLTFLLTFRRQNFMHQINPINFVSPYNTKHSSILALIFVSMLTTAIAILENYKKIIKLNGFYSVLYPIILIPVLMLLGIFYLPDFVAFSQIQRYQRRSAAVAGVWTSMCRVLLEIGFLVQAIANQYTGSFIGSRVGSESEKFFAIAQDLPQIVSQVVVLIWFARQCFALKGKEHEIDQTAELVYLHKASYEKDYKYTRELFAQDELKKRTGEIQHDRDDRIPEPGIFRKRKSSPSDSTKPRATFMQKLAAIVDRILFHPYRKLDPRFRVLYVMAIYVVWITLVKYVRLVSDAKVGFGCHMARAITFIEIVTAKGRFAPFQFQNPFFVSKVADEYFDFAQTLARLLEAASALAVAFTLISALFNVVATAKSVRKQMRMFARGRYPEHFSKKRSYSADVSNLSQITGKLIGYVILGALAFFGLLFALLLLIFWGIAFLAFSPTLRDWLRHNTALWIFITTIVVNIIWSKLQTFIVLRAFTVDGLRFKYKTGFFFWEFIVMFANVQKSINSFVSRFILAAFSTVFYMGRMDVQIVHGFLSKISGFSTYHQFVYAAYVYSNSVSNTFIGLLLDGHFKRRLARQRQFSFAPNDVESAPYGKKSDATQVVVQPTTTRRTPSRTAAKFWLALYLHRNPTLRYYRKHYVVKVLSENPHGAQWN